MRELLQTNETVLLTFVEALLKDAGIAATVFDRSMSAVEGSIGAFPRRVLVAEGDWERARALLVDADLGRWVSEDDRR